MLEMIMKNHNFLCKRGTEARSSSLSGYFSKGLGVTPAASTVFREGGSTGVNSSNTVGLISPFRFNSSTEIAVSIRIIWSWCLGPHCAGTPSRKAQAAREQPGMPGLPRHDALPKQAAASAGV